MHINSISCGQGAPSLYLLALAWQGVIPATLVVVADTGAETDMLWSTGERSSAGAFFEQVTRPLAEEWGLEAVYVRSLKKDGTPYPPLPDSQDPEHLDLPLFGSRGGRASQTCTSKYKIQAIRQELRRRGAKTATCYLGLTKDEVHRMKTTDRKWSQNSYPLIEMRPMGRPEIEAELARLGVPWIVRSQCDICPHKNLFRWRMNRPETILAAAEFERRFAGYYFLTKKRIPLLDALAAGGLGVEEPDSCDSGYCFT